ncbi:agglutinin-like protein, partial [Scheffersomyces coipomensis]|uniref:agglutinin-like protein n=1 Tax=Scheffersomyces coipomensis TaxID=1788519 RepID=UPI00315D5823
PESAGWNAAIGWTLSNATAQPGDAFALNMPDVFGFDSDSDSDSTTTTKRMMKRATTNPTIYLSSDGISYASCELISAGLTGNSSSIQCTILDSINTLPAGTPIDGELIVPIVFNVGGSGSASDLAAANAIQPGPQVITFDDGDFDISLDVDFAAGASSPEDPDDIVYAIRAMPWDNEDSIYVLGGSCGTNLSVSGDLGIQVTDGSLDCSSYEALMTNNLNAWYFPKSDEVIPSVSLVSCSSSEILISYENLPLGYRAFMDLLAVPDSTDFSASYTNSFTC